MYYFKYPFQLDQVGKPLLVAVEDNIKDCLKLLFLQSIEERKILVGFGSTLNDYVFEIPNEINYSLLEREIIEKIWQYEKRIYDIEIKVSFHENVLWIDMKYKIYEKKKEQNMQVKFNLK